MYILNIASAIKKMSVNELRDFTFGNYNKPIGFGFAHVLFNETFEKKCLLLVNKSTEKVPDPCNVMLKNTISHL